MSRNVKVAVKPRKREEIAWWNFENY